MGGFAGGDEAGYWDIDTPSTSIDKENSSSKYATKKKSYIDSSESHYSIKAPAKVNIFLKITEYVDGCPTLFSRVMRVDELYDTISFVPCRCETFTIEGCDDIPLESNTIYKAYKALYDFTDDADIADFFSAHKVVVTKRIALSAGLGGSSSDAAAFLHLAKEVCNLVLSSDELVKIGSTVGTYVPFFLCDYPSANVSGFGETVELFEEEPLDLKLYTPNIQCDTAVVYTTFKKYFLADAPLSSSLGWERLDSKTILEQNTDPSTINDLYAASLLAYPELKKEAKTGWFFSGSGSTFFKY